MRKMMKNDNGDREGNLEQELSLSMGEQYWCYIVTRLKETVMGWISCCFPFFRFYYLFIFREGKGVRKRGRETSVCGCLSHAPCWGPVRFPGCALTGNLTGESLAGLHSIHWATPTRAGYFLFKKRFQHLHFLMLEF